MSKTEREALADWNEANCCVDVVTPCGDCNSCLTAQALRQPVPDDEQIAAIRHHLTGPCRYEVSELWVWCSRLLTKLDTVTAERDALKDAWEPVIRGVVCESRYHAMLPGEQLCLICECPSHSHSNDCPVPRALKELNDGN